MTTKMCVEPDLALKAQNITYEDFEKLLEDQANDMIEARSSSHV